MFREINIFIKDVIFTKFLSKSRESKFLKFSQLLTYYKAKLPKVIAIYRFLQKLYDF